MLIFLLFCMLLYTLCSIDKQLTQPQTHIDEVIENILLDSNGGDDAGPRGIQPRGPNRDGASLPALLTIEASSHALFLFEASSHKLYTFEILLDSTRGVYDDARPRGIQPRGPTEDEVLLTSNRGDYNSARPRGIRPREPTRDAASLPALFTIEASSHATQFNVNPAMGQTESGITNVAEKLMDAQIASIEFITTVRAPTTKSLAPARRPSLNKVGSIVNRGAQPSASERVDDQPLVAPIIGIIAQLAQYRTRQSTLDVRARQNAVLLSTFVAGRSRFDAIVAMDHTVNHVTNIFAMNAPITGVTYIKALGAQTKQSIASITSHLLLSSIKSIEMEGAFHLLPPQQINHTPSVQSQRKLFGLGVLNELGGINNPNQPINFVTNMNRQLRIICHRWVANCLISGYIV